MKKNIHPKTRLVVFKDLSSGFQIITSSAAETKQTVEVDGQSYPLISFDVSSASHPFYTGKQRLVDTEGRAERFMKKYKGFWLNGKKGQKLGSRPAQAMAKQRLIEKSNQGRSSHS